MHLTILTLITLALFHALTAGAFAQSSPEEQGRLQGTWEGVEVGREADGKCTMTITGDAVYFQGSKKDEWYRATITLPPGTDPKQLRAIIRECSQPDVAGKWAVAIYKIEEGTLTLVGHPPGAPDAPKNFEGDATSRSFVLKKPQTPKKNPGLITDPAIFQDPPADKPLVAEVRLDLGIVSKLAATLAATLANKEAKKKSNVEPFSAANAKAVFRGDRWDWQAIVGYGKGDMMATVSFAQDGSEQRVEIKLLVNEVDSGKP